jgi:hypothetical protein
VLCRWGNPFGCVIGGRPVLSAATIRVEALKDPDDKVYQRMIVKCGYDISSRFEVKFDLDFTPDVFFMDAMADLT